MIGNFSAAVARQRDQYLPCIFLYSMQQVKELLSIYTVEGSTDITLRLTKGVRLAASTQ